MIRTYYLSPELKGQLRQTLIKDAKDYRYAISQIAGSIKKYRERMAGCDTLAAAQTLEAIHIRIETLMSKCIREFDSKDFGRVSRLEAWYSGQMGKWWSEFDRARDEYQKIQRYKGMPAREGPEQYVPERPPALPSTADNIRKFIERFDAVEKSFAELKALVENQRSRAIVIRREPGENTIYVTSVPWDDSWSTFEQMRRLKEPSSTATFK